MGESKKDALRVKFDKKLKLEFHGVKVTSDAILFGTLFAIGGFAASYELS